MSRRSTRGGITEHATALSFSQNSKIDSLEKVLLILKEDTSKVDLLNTLSVEYRSSNPEKSLEYGKKARDGKLSPAEMSRRP